MKLNQIKKNPNNPRTIKDKHFERLKRSIEEFPEMMKLRPLVVDENNVILGGNMRFEAIKSICISQKRDEIPDDWVKRVDELTEEQKQQFIIKDNASFGDWDWDALANEWSDLPLNEWGLEIPLTEPLPNIEDFFAPESDEPKTDGKEKLILEFVADELDRVKTELLKHGTTYESAVWHLLGLDA